jgi:hypothetical protein
MNYATRQSNVRPCRRVRVGPTMDRAHVERYDLMKHVALVDRVADERRRRGHMASVERGCRVGLLHEGYSGVKKTSA